jgi:hypothetical protein
LLPCLCSFTTQSLASHTPLASLASLTSLASLASLTSLASLASLAALASLDSRAYLTSCVYPLLYAGRLSFPLALSNRQFIISPTHC